MTPEHGLALVNLIARDFHYRHHDDVVSAGHYALASLLARGVPPTRRKLKSTIIDILRQETGYRRTYRPHTVHLSCVRSRLADSAPTPDVQAQRSELVDLLDTLPSRERDVLTMHFLQGLTHREIGRRIRRTASRVSQIQAEALTRLLTRPRCRVA